MWWMMLSVALADDVQLILADPTTSDSPRDACDQPVCVSLLELIDGSTRTLDLAFYGFRRQSALFAAAKRAQGRGVRVRLVVDRTLDGGTYYDDTEQWVRAFASRTDLAVDRAQARRQRQFFGNPRCPRPDGFAGPVQCLAYDLGDTCLLTAHASREPITFQGDIMHHKFAVADGAHLWTGSTNASDSGTGGYNANLVLKHRQPTPSRRWYDRRVRTNVHVDGQFHRTKPRKTPTSREHWIVDRFGSRARRVLLAPGQAPRTGRAAHSCRGPERESISRCSSSPTRRWSRT